MHEQAKIDEAARLLERMLDDVNDPVRFKDDFSAFSTAARSVLQYVLEEIRDRKPLGGQQWYDNLVAVRPLIRFFKDKRDTNVHKKPVPPATDANLTIRKSIGVSSTLTHQVIRGDGTREAPVTVTSPPAPPAPPSDSSLTYSYTFTDWTGMEDVSMLSAAYLDEVRSAVADGIANGFVTR